MSKIKLNGSDNISVFSICRNNANNDATILLPTDVEIEVESLIRSSEGVNSRIIINDPLTIELQNNHTLIMPSIDSDQKVTFDITSGHLILNSVAPGASLCIHYQGNNYQFTNLVEANKGNNGCIYFGDVNYFIKICETVNSFFTNEESVIGIDPDLYLERISSIIVEYQKLNHDLVTSFMQQNNKVSTTVIDSVIFIINPFGELKPLPANIEDTPVNLKLSEKAVNELLHKVCPIKPDDLKLELAGANGYNPENTPVEEA